VKFPGEISDSALIAGERVVVVGMQVEGVGLSLDLPFELCCRVPGSHRTAHIDPVVSVGVGHAGGVGVVEKSVVGKDGDVGERLAGRVGDFSCEKARLKTQRRTGREKKKSNDPVDSVSDTQIHNARYSLGRDELLWGLGSPFGLCWELFEFGVSVETELRAVVLDQLHSGAAFGAGIVPEFWRVPRQ